MAEQIGIAIQGAGWVATEHIRAYQRNRSARIVAVGSRTLDGARQKAAEMGIDGVALFDDYDQMLAHPEVRAVSICTPPGRHPLETIKAARAGKHVLIEKPAALSVDSLRDMDAAVTGADVVSVVSFVLRWNPAVINIKSLQDMGALGEIFLVQADYWHNLEQAGLADKTDDINTMITGGCHAVDLVRHVVGHDVISVTAQSWSKSGSDPTDTVCILRFQNGAVAKVSACTSQWMPYNFNIDVFGTDGAIRGDQLYTRRLPGLTRSATLPSILPDSGDVAHHPFGAEIDHFIDCIQTGTESPVSLRRAVNTHEVCFAAVASDLAGGQPIDLPLKDVP